ncbi:uncharacterized protein LOC141536251 [Cotesia typhae]|uniref:uncharacterized protein LOC141536251 n=1 Tax=Cotesia typhae TaxID=2053667 RepID=UPI003D6951C2
MSVKWIISAIIVLEVQASLKAQVQSHKPTTRVKNYQKFPLFINEDRKNNIEHRSYPYAVPYSSRPRYRLAGKPYGFLRKRRPGIPAVFLRPPLVKKHRNRNYKSNRQKRPQKPRNSPEANSSEDNSKEEEYIRDHDPAQQTIEEVKDETAEYDDSDDYQEEKLKGSDEDRVDFHVHGHQGPDSYIFGFDTGKGKNRQFRLEEKHGNGTVTGYYGYYDPTGKLRKIHYNSNASTGYQQQLIHNKNNDTVD